MSAQNLDVETLSKSNIMDDPTAALGGSIRLGSLYHITMQPYVPLMGAILYLFMVAAWERANKRQRQCALETSGQAKSAPRTGANLKPFIVAHNLILAIYSLWTFVDFFPEVLRAVVNHGLKDGLCDAHAVLWSGKLLKHGLLFYLSKYYEFIDTAIILAKGRDVGRLQTFHHAGAVLVMWFGNYTQSPYLSFFVFENSIIHTLMYSYYTLTALGLRPPGKQILTRMQIAQFYIALSGGACYLALFRCQNTAQTWFTCVFMAYIVELIRLFTLFARKTYGQRGNAGSSKQKIA
ncbi:hypothetical protein GGI23_003799 [Coemansia sp. RSA 2559]|nr:hypothetical protein GGI23_003799 [Coemansia sp. RSA 2559]KAJ2854824.1 hypothetical protein GGI22_004355 [Coemansia erecta]